jgi:hypothetical protein
MARRRRTAAGMDSLQDLARKTEILERELAVQRQAIERLKAMANTTKHVAATVTPLVRKTA